LTLEYQEISILARRNGVSNQMQRTPRLRLFSKAGVTGAGSLIWSLRPAGLCMKPPIPEFGKVAPGCRYDLRPGAHAVLRHDARRIAVVLTSLGDFLAGGGQALGESSEQVLRRETLEECGLDV